MTIQLFAWALMNGLIVLAVGGGILLWQRQKRAEREQERLEDDIARRQDELDRVNQRVADLEQRLDLSERQLPGERAPVPRHDTRQDR
jgi:type VI protein secretion system component VasK